MEFPKIGNLSRIIVTMATIGMMDAAFFVGRQEILTWLNTFLSLHYLKIEDTFNGAASCQIIDALHPGVVALGRVDYGAQREFECAQNYNVLQDAFTKIGIEKVLPLAYLILTQTVTPNRFLKMSRPIANTERSELSLV